VAKQPAKTDRQAVIEQMRKKQKSAERRRGTVIVVTCVVIALFIVGLAAIPIIKDKWDARKLDNTALSDLGAAASSCEKVTTKKAEGNQEHVPVGTEVDYPESPPAFGKHWNEAGVAPAPFARKFYTTKDRPEIEALVHNLEHGYTILWYDETIAGDSDALDEVQAIAEKFEGDSLRDKFIAAPWKKSDDDEGTFPDGEHVALTHWSAGGVGETDTTKQVGVWQYCSAPSGAAVEDFVKKYPYFDSPEPDAM